MKIRFAQFQVNDGFTGAFQLFGARVDGQRAFAGQLGNTCGNFSRACRGGHGLGLRRILALWGILRALTAFLTQRSQRTQRNQRGPSGRRDDRLRNAAPAKATLAYEENLSTVEILWRRCGRWVSPSIATPRS